MSDLGHGALCACQQCRSYRADQYEGRHRKDAELAGLVLFDLNQVNDLKVLVRSMQPATDDLKGDDLI